MNTFTGASLLELLRFHADKYVHITKNLVKLEELLEREQDGASEKTKSTCKLLLEAAKDRCEEIGLQVSARHAKELLFNLSSEFLRADGIRALYENIERELDCQFFVGISPERLSYFCDTRKGWESILSAFPSATDDVEEMNKCFALCRYPAAVFHCLMVTEHGLVALGKKLGTTDHKVGWDATSRKLGEIVEAGYKQNQSGLTFAFLEQVNACVHTMKFAWRNKVSHAAGKLVVMDSKIAPGVAQDIISATHNFMNRLQDGGIKEPDWLEQL